jgi:hypothetical protein
MTSIEFYERDTVIKRIGDNLNQISQKYFEGTHGILSVTDNGDYVTVKTQGLFVANYDIQKLWDALENFSQEDREFLFPYGLWNYLDNCKYTLPKNQDSSNEKTDNELSFSEKDLKALVDQLLGKHNAAREAFGLDDKGKEEMTLFPYTGTQTITFKLRIKAKSREEAEEKFKKIWLNSHIDQDCWWNIEQEGIEIILEIISVLFWQMQIGA